MSNQVKGGETWTAFDIVPISPNDNEDLPTNARAIRCKPSGEAGKIRITTRSGETRDTEISVGEVLSVYVVRVHNSGTDATGLEALI